MSAPLLLVHQVGKVGSTSVARVLQRMYPRQKIHQTHTLDEATLLWSLDRWLRHPDSPRLKLADHLTSSIELSRHFRSEAEPLDCWVVSLVREPMGRNVSAFFQNLHRHWVRRLSPEGQDIHRRLLANPLAAPKPIAADEAALLVRELTALFKDHVGPGRDDRWFDREVRGVFGIDVFERPFAAERGYQIYRHGSVRMLLIRLEDLPRVFLPAIEEWFQGSPFAAGIDRSVSFERERSNDGSTKAYADVYQGFLRELRVRADYLDEVYGSRVARKFYTDGERAEFRGRWKTEAVS